MVSDLLPIHSFRHRLHRRGRRHIHCLIECECGLLPHLRDVLGRSSVRASGRSRSTSMKQARPVLLRSSRTPSATSIAAGTSDQKSAPAMPITLIVAADNFLTRHHAFMRYKFCWVDAGQPRSPRPDRTLSRGMKGHQVAPDRS